MSSLEVVGSQIVPNHSHIIDNPSSKWKSLGFAIIIIVGVGGFAVLGAGLSGLGVHQMWWAIGAFSNLGQVNAIIMMVAGGGLGMTCLIIGVIGSVRNCQRQQAIDSVGDDIVPVSDVSVPNTVPVSDVPASNAVPVIETPQVVPAIAKSRFEGYSVVSGLDPNGNYWNAPFKAEETINALKEKIDLLYQVVMYQNLWIDFRTLTPQENVTFEQGAQAYKPPDVACGYSHLPPTHSMNLMLSRYMFANIDLFQLLPSYFDGTINKEAQNDPSFSNVVECMAKAHLIRSELWFRGRSYMTQWDQVKCASMPSAATWLPHQIKNHESMLLKFCVEHNLFKDGLQSTSLNCCRFRSQPNLLDILIQVG